MLDYIFSADLDIGHVCITTLFKIVRTTGLDGRSAICPGPRLATVHSSISLMPVPPNWATSLGEVIAKWRSATGAAETYKYMANPPYDKFFLTEAAESWEEFLQWLGELRGHWCFRGQREAEWLLNTFLDRAVIVRHETEYSQGYYHLPRSPIERDFLFRFQFLFVHAHRSSRL